jgi:hypothetical protein
VADALITIEKLAEVRKEQEAGVIALRDASQLSRFHWQHCAGIQSDLYRSLLAGGRA